MKDKSSGFSGWAQASTISSILRYEGRDGQLVKDNYIGATPGIVFSVPSSNPPLLLPTECIDWPKKEK